MLRLYRKGPQSGQRAGKYFRGTLSAIEPAMAREHYTLVEALRSIEEPEFTNIVRKTHTAFALRWISSAGQVPVDSAPAHPTQK